MENDYERRRVAAVWVKILVDEGTIYINLDNVESVALESNAALVYFASGGGARTIAVDGEENVKELERCINVANNAGGSLLRRG